MNKSASIIVVVLALILGFIGGAVTPHLLPIAGVTAVEKQIGQLSAELQRVETVARRVETVAPPLRIAFMDAERAFAVILEVVEGLRRRAREKQAEITELHRQHRAGEIAAEEFRDRNNILNVELLQAQLAINLGALEKMIVGRGFRDIRGDLEQLRDQAQSLQAEVSGLLLTTQIGGFPTQEAFDRDFALAQAAFSHLDHVLTQVATMMIARAAQEVGLEMGFDLVLLQRNVLIYRNPIRILDVTVQVSTRMAEYLRP
ncbi:hypothetical protein LM599_04595 [Candidatus Acetothermia bacterium]|jgi:hypothetical protein|nr:hypothetical protein [Candidatus Acetothermia bacterium]MCI2427146.1 hypothetical protein [Candidatus Acetothermia bacterium]MCI2428668.1 hypothetical protein [Candidatus Acetothermia bacterium]